MRSLIATLPRDFARLLPPSLTCLLFMACTQGNPVKPSPTVPSGPKQVEGRYVVAGNKIILTDPDTLHSTCDGDTLRIQGNPIRIDTTEFEVKGDTLFILKATVEEGAFKALAYDVFLRQGSGNGLTGIWRAIGRASRNLTPETPIPDDYKHFFDHREINELHTHSFKYVEFNGSLKAWYQDRAYAYEFIRSWKESGDSGRYAIDVDSAGRKTLTLHGRLNGETVRITGIDLFGLRYESDNPAHATYTYRFDAVTCPNPFDPAWYIEFMVANRIGPP